MLLLSLSLPLLLLLSIIFLFQLWKTTSGVEYRQKKVENAAFYVNEQIDEVIKETEVFFFYFNLLTHLIKVQPHVSLKARQNKS